MVRSTLLCIHRRLLLSVIVGFIFSQALVGQNAIVTENALPGNPYSEWGVPNFRDNSIAGFATKMSLNRGETVRFKINVQSGVSFTLKIYRIGYYGGNGARLMADLGSFTGTIQPNGNYNSSTGLLDCGNWSESASWSIPANAVSGFYIAKLERTGGGSNHIAFIVRNDVSHSDMYFQLPDATWQAYNGYGGNSLYDGTTSWPSGHAVKVSYNRPFFPYNSLFNTDGREADWYMNAEYPMIRWLERNGYDVTYTSCNDVANNGSRLLNHRVFVTVGHDEYWSKGHRDNVEAARNAGVHLAFFTGNEVYWKTRWEDNNGSEDRTLVCYKEGLLGDGTIGERSCGTKCDPSAEWTGLWRTGGNYDAGRPENSLVGQISWVEYPTNITVPSTYKNLRFWRNSAVANLSSGQTVALGINTLGYEWDYEQPAYASTYPPGRITMSSTTSNGVTHKLSLYRHSSGALVFGAGTVQWSWGLDGSHWGGSTTTSSEMQQATVNLFADMGAQPGTLQSGLTAASQSSDFTAPTASITSPASGATFSSGTNITFSGSSTDIGGGVVAAVEISTNGGSTWSQATFTSAAGSISWTYSWTAATDGTYNVKVRGVDDSGNIGDAGSGITITIGAGGDVTPPLVSTVSPLTGATGVSLTTTVTADFNESINPATVTGSTFQLRDASNNLINATVGGSANEITLTPSSPLTASSTYTATIFGGSSGVKDVSGNALVNNYSWSFTTGTETAPPPSVLTINSFTTKTGVGSQSHALTGVPAGALLVLATTADAAPMNCSVSSTPSLTWTKRSDAGAAQSDNAEIWTAVFAAGGSITINSSWGPDHSQSSICYVVLNAESTLGGASATAVSQAAPSVTITTSRENSIIFGCTADFNARNGTSRVLRDNATERLYYRDGNYTTYHYTKAAQTVAAYTEGVSSPANQQASTALLEIRGVQSTPDITPPLVASVSPANAATGVATNATVSAVFNEDMDANTINSSTIELRNSSNALVSATVSYDVNTKTATLTPASALTNSHTYSAKVKSGASGVKDASGNALASDYDWSFTTVVGDITPPTVSSVTPANAATGVLVGSSISAVFSEAMDASTINSSTIELRNASNVLVAGTVSYNASTRTVTFTPSAALTYSQQYTATIKSGSAGVKDAAGNALAADFIWSFTTETGDIIPPTVSSVTPTNGATGVLVGSTVTAVFSEAMDASTISGSTVELRNASNVLVTATVSYNATTRTVTLTPSTTLANSQVYSAKIKSGATGVKDAAGNALAADYNWSFTTEPGDIIPPTVTSVTPTNGATGVLVGSVVTAVFSEAMDASTISGSTVELRNASNVLVTATVSYNATTRTVTLTPSAALANSQVYSAKIKSGATGVKDVSGNALAADFNWSFTTEAGDITPPTVSSVTPANGATGVLVSSTVTAVFSEAMDATTISGSTIELRNASNVLVAATVSYNATTRTVTLTPSATLANSQVYSAKIKSGGTGVKDISGNALVADFNWSFTTVAGDITPPTVMSVTPVNGATGVLVSSTISAVFSEAMDATTISGSTIELRNPLNVLVTATVSYNATTRTVTLTPSGVLANLQVYSARIKSGTTGVKDVAGNALAADYTWSFTTVVADITPPTVTSVTPANAATSVSLNTSVTATFSEAINGSTVSGTTFQLRDAASNIVGATVSSSSNQITLTPTVSLAASTTYTATITGGGSGVKDLAGNALASNYTWTFTTVANSGGTTYTVFQSSNAPTVPLANDGTGIELGMRFRSTQDGFINGIRYYKGAGASGTHIGSLWTNTGTRLAQATFVNETASGWQQVLFSSPIAITANVTYVATYFSPSGDYAGTKPYFTQNIVNGPLIGLADGTDGANGVYRYTTTSAFPTSTFQSSNYWVDVVFAPGIDNVPPVVAGVSPLSGATGVGLSAVVTATFNEAINAATVTTSTFQLRNASNTLITATVNTSSNQITLTPSAPLSASTVYTATITGGSSGVKDPAGNALASNYSWSFTTQASDITPPTVTAVTPANGATAVIANTTTTATFSEAVNVSTVTGTTFQLRDAGNNLIPATVSTSSNIITLTPSASLSASTTYNVTIVGGASGVKDLAGNALASNYTWSFTTAGGGGGTTYTLFVASSTPTVPLAHDGQGIELGMRFRSTQSGYINGIRYYKGAGTTGIHIGSLWNNTGTRLAQATFTNETASGWQQVLFSTPVAITAGVTYVASYFSPSGDYCATKPYFTQNIVNGPLIGLADGTDGGNGLYRYTASSAFPNSTFQSSNYWVDVVFAPGAVQSRPAVASPVITSTKTIESEVYQYSLGQNYPNPVHKGTRIPFTIPIEQKVQLSVYDKSGKLVKMLLNGSQSAGKHIVNFNPGALASGVYYYKIKAGEFTEVRKLIIK